MSDRPAVTVLMANYNGARYLEAAIRSVLRQTFVDLEVLVVDDASTDESLMIIERLVGEDGRIRCLVQSANAGPGAARNRGLEVARGRWIAIVDSDDLMHPQRIEQLVGTARQRGCHIIADDLLVFYEGDARRAHRFLKGRFARGPTMIEAAEYLRLGSLYDGAPNLGFLKPIFLAEALSEHGLRYDERLRIGEDFDLVARALMVGLTMVTDPFPSYLYRKHDESTSHRMKAANLEALIQAAEGLAQLAINPTRQQAFRRYRGSLLNALAYERVIDALRARSANRAIREMCRRPMALPLLWMPVRARFNRLLARLFPRHNRYRDPASVCILSRQRLVGENNGSSTYLLSLCRGLQDAGFTLHLIQPSPVLFGRRPILWLRPEMDVFASHAVRGGLRVGRLLLCCKLGVWLAAMRGVAAKLLALAGLPNAFLRSRRAPYAIASPWRPEDAVFVAAHAATASAAVVTDYAFQNVMIPYLPCAARSAVIMHDLFCRRAEQFQAREADDATILISENEEMALLAMADTIVAIQKDEAEFVRSRIVGSSVIVAPMGVETAAHASPGFGAELLFVGSNAAPNVVGLQWFIDLIWPEIQSAEPKVSLTVAGSVADAFTTAPKGIRFEGLVNDLRPLYARAAVVISPLTVGSGLKIKLIEAMANGKAVVATAATVQGVEDLVEGAVARADTPGAFASATVRLLADRDLRSELGERALEVTRQRFGAATAVAPLVNALR